MTGTSRAVFEIGLLNRQEFRRVLLKRGLTFNEDKGLLDSLFVVTGPAPVIEGLLRMARQIGDN